MVEKNNKMITLSIIIPAYNAEKFMSNTIKHLSKIQSDFEIVVVDDGSKDNTLNVCRYLENEYPNLFVCTQPNSGVSAARNLGIEKARGKWLFFCDADDWVDAGNIEEILCIAEKHEGQIILAGMNFVKSNGINYHPVPDNVKFTPEEFLNSPAFQGSSCNYLFPSEIIRVNQVKFPVGIVNTEDQNFNMKCIACSKGIYSRNIPVYNYNHLNDDAAHRSNKSFKWKIGPLESSLDLIEFCEKQNIDIKLMQVQINRLVEDFYREHTSEKFTKEERCQIMHMLKQISQYCLRVKHSPKYKAMRISSVLGLMLLRLYNRYILKK